VRPTFVFSDRNSSAGCFSSSSRRLPFNADILGGRLVPAMKTENAKLRFSGQTTSKPVLNARIIGSCRDYAALLMEGVRHWVFGARFVTVKVLPV
jgi:hypothetical protein